MSTWIILIIIIVIILIVWWALLRSAKTYKPDFEAHHEEPAVEAETQPVPAGIAETPPPAAPLVEDLTIVEGIGPKVNSLLHAAGITSFAQLAEAEVGRLREILEAADLRFIDPGTWGEQAKLAAEGKLDELKTLQDNLKGGRKV
jgi:predicted flap endonuclease-1-like 5' DNA nuclease